MTSIAQTQWDVVRSELMNRLERCEARAEPADAPIFFTQEAEPYYGPTRDARAAVNVLLGLPCAAGQQEWQDELKRAGRLDFTIEALGNSELDLETRSALSLLLLDAVDGMAIYGPVRAELLSRIRWHLRRYPQVQSRMRYFWTNMDASSAVLEALS